MGATTNDLAELFDVNPDTIADWKKKSRPFSEAITKGKAEMDAEVEKSLFKRAMGYQHPDTHVSVCEGRVIQTPLVKHYPPDTAAASLWLRNRQPAKWRDKTDVEHSGGISLTELAVEIVKARKKGDVITPAT